MCRCRRIITEPLQTEIVNKPVLLEQSHGLLNALIRRGHISDCDTEKVPLQIAQVKWCVLVCEVAHLDAVQIQVTYVGVVEILATDALRCDPPLVLGT